MRAQPVERFLTRFGSSDCSPGTVLTAMPEIAPVDQDAIIAAERDAARAQGYDDGFSAARSEGELALAAVRADAEAELAAARECWLGEEATRLADRIAMGFVDLTDEIAGCVEQVLRPFLVGAARDRAMRDLVTALGRLERGDRLLRIAGPDEFIEVLRGAEALADRSVEFVSRPETDVLVVADATVIETRLAAWVASLTAPAAEMPRDV